MDPFRQRRLARSRHHVVLQQESVMDLIRLVAQPMLLAMRIVTRPYLRRQHESTVSVQRQGSIQLSGEDPVGTFTLEVLEDHLRERMNVAGLGEGRRLGREGPYAVAGGHGIQNRWVIDTKTMVWAPRSRRSARKEFRTDEWQMVSMTCYSQQFRTLVLPWPATIYSTSSISTRG